MQNDSDTVAPIINFLVAGASCYFLTPTYCKWLGFQVDWLAYFLSFVATGLLVVCIVRPIFRVLLWNRNRSGRTKEKNYSENVSLRRLKGIFTDFIILAGFGAPAYFYGPQYIKITGIVGTIPHISVGLAGFSAFILYLFATRFGKKYFGIFIKPFRFRRYRFGKGGSASFSKMVDE